MKNKYRILVFLSGIILVVQAARWMENIAVWLFVGAVNAMLMVACWGAGRLARKGRRLYANILIVLACLVWGAVTFGMETIGRATVVTTNPYYYDRVMKGLASGNTGLVAHFPEKIPGYVKGVWFSSEPGFLQGGMHVQLRYQTSSDDIAALFKRFSAIKQKSYAGGDSNVHMNLVEGMPTTFFYTSDKGDRSFPPDYEIMTLDPVLPAADRRPGFYWNHGQSHGVAISRLRNEIVFWAESW